jgi:hypothetical protein
VGVPKSVQRIRALISIGLGDLFKHSQEQSLHSNALESLHVRSAHAMPSKESSRAI